MWLVDLKSTPLITDEDDGDWEDVDDVSSASDDDISMDAGDTQPGDMVNSPIISIAKIFMMTLKLDRFATHLLFSYVA